MRRLRIQLWSWHYAPEPIGIAPVSEVWAKAMRARGHDIEVVTAHPHYPAALWGRRLLPYRELRDGVPVIRLPLWLGRRTPLERIRQELTHAAATAGAMSLLRRPDVVVSVTPSFAALAPMVLNVRLRRLPWILWIQDIVPDAAETTGLVTSRVLLRGASVLERSAYRAAERIVVISEAFARNLRRKGVPLAKLEVVYNPATRGFAQSPAAHHTAGSEARILYMGNIGYSQGLLDVVRAFQQPGGPPAFAKLVVAGHGELVSAVRTAITSDRVEMLGLIAEEQLDTELDRATLGLVAQRADITEFNLPSKLMTLMARGVPILASVSPSSEVARLVRDSGAGWIVDGARADVLGPTLERILADRDEIGRRGAAALEYARRRFSAEAIAARFEAILVGADGGRDPERQRTFVSPSEDGEPARSTCSPPARPGDSA